MALSWKEGGPPQFRPPPRLPGAPIPPVPNPMVKLEQLLIKLQIKKMEILGFIETKKRELIAKAKEEVQKAIRAALGIIKKPQEEMIAIAKRKAEKIKKKIEKIKKKKEEIEKKIAKLQALYDKYKNLDEALYAEAVRLLEEQIAKYKKQIEDELAEMKKKVKEELKRKKEWAIGKLEIENKKEKIATIKKKIDNIKIEYKQVQEKVEEIQEIIAKIQYIIEHPEEEAMKVLKPILEEKKKKLEEKLEPIKKKLKEKLDKLKKRIASITAGLPNVQGAIIYQSFSAGVAMYWVGAIINPGPGVPNGIIVTFPGTPISTFNITFDMPNQGDDPAEGIRKMVPMIKQHLATISGLYLLPTGTPPFTPLPWVGYGSTIEWESMFVQPVALGLKNGMDSMGNLLADNYDRAIKTGFPNAPSIPIPYTVGVAQKIKSLTAIGDMKSVVDVIKAMLYQIPILPIEKATKELMKKKNELENKIVKPIIKEKEKIEEYIAKIEEYKKKVEEYTTLVMEYVEWANEQAAAVEYYSNPSMVMDLAAAAAEEAAAGSMDAASTLSS